MNKREANTTRFNKGLAYFLIVYGLMFVIVDKIDWVNAPRILSNSTPESLMMRLVNLIFCISLMIGGYLMLERKRDAWYFLNFASIGIVLKFIFIIFLTSFMSYGNFLTNFYIHELIAVLCFLYSNTKAFKSHFNVSLKKPAFKLIIIFIASAATILFFCLEESIWDSEDRVISNYHKLIYVNNENGTVCTESYSIKENLFVDLIVSSQEYAVLNQMIPQLTDFTGKGILNNYSVGRYLYNHEYDEYEVFNKIFQLDERTFIQGKLVSSGVDTSDVDFGLIDVFIVSIH